jgi:8-oxo-dGTP diphosphatase
VVKTFRNPALSTDAVWIAAGEILLVRRRRPPFRGRWALPGGFVEYTETVEEALVREIKEETGLRARPRALVGVYSGPDRDPRHPTTSIAFFVSGRRSRPRAGDDAAEVRWVPLAKAKGLAFDHDEIVRDARRQLSRRRQQR